MPDADIPLLDDAACQRALAILVDVGTSIAQELKTPAKDITPPPAPPRTSRSPRPSAAPFSSPNTSPWLAAAAPQAVDNDASPNIRLKEH